MPPISWYSKSETGDMYSHAAESVTVTFWLVALVAGAWPLVSAALFVHRRRASRRSPPNHCHRCGYDLRATLAANGPMLAVCPGCGEKATAEG